MKNYNIKELQDKLERCRNVSLDEVGIDDVDELSSVKINTRMNQVNIINKTKNPYIFKVNGRLVKIEFCNNGKKAEDAITNVIKSIYK